LGWPGSAAETGSQNSFCNNIGQEERPTCA
jgi:hypothetical protein